MIYKLTTPATVGDLANSISVDMLELKSLSLTFDPLRPVLSIVLIHPASGWEHVVTYTDSSAVQFWAQTLAAQFDEIANAAIQKLVADGKLPPGTADSAVLRGVSM